MRRTENDYFNASIILPANSTDYQDVGLTNIYYYYKVVCYNSIGSTSSEELGPIFPIIDRINIASAREDNNLDGRPDKLGQIVKLNGIVISENYQSLNQSYFVWDGSAGINEFLSGTAFPDLRLGDSLEIIGQVDQFRGLTEIVPKNSKAISIIDSNKVLPKPYEITIAKYLANPEMYEGELLKFNSIIKLNNYEWPPLDSSVTIKVTDGSGVVDLRMDSDTDIDGSLEPTWPVDLICIGSQFTTENNLYFDGYQLLPRFYSDFVQSSNIPVEFLNISCNLNNDNQILLIWATATETNNNGFVIERNLNDIWSDIAFIKGKGTTTIETHYKYEDTFDQMIYKGMIKYRLKQIDLDGTYKYSNEAIAYVDLSPKQYYLAQNYPNPFNPITTIKYTIPQKRNILLKIFDILGNELTTLVNEEKDSGNYEVKFDGSNLASGIYYYQMQAGDFIATKKFILMK